MTTTIVTSCIEILCNSHSRDPGITQYLSWWFILRKIFKNKGLESQGLSTKPPKISKISYSLIKELIIIIHLIDSTNSLMRCDSSSNWPRLTKTGSKVTKLNRKGMRVEWPDNCESKASKSFPNSESNGIESRLRHNCVLTKADSMSFA